MTTMQGTPPPTPELEESVEAFEARLAAENPALKAELDQIIDGIPDPSAPAPTATPTPPQAPQATPPQATEPTPPAATTPAPPQATEPTATPTPTAAPTPPQPGTDAQPELTTDQVLQQQNSKLAAENLQLKYQAEQARVAGEIAKMEQDEKARLLAAGWDEEAAAESARSLGALAKYDNDYIQLRGRIQDEAFRLGQEHGLTIEQVKTLATATTPQAFQSSLQEFVGAQTPAEKQLRAELEALKQKDATRDVEIADLKKQMVPNGQVFGNIPGGGGPSAPPQNVPALATEILDSGRMPTDEEWKMLDEYWASP